MRARLVEAGSSLDGRIAGDFEGSLRTGDTAEHQVAVDAGRTYTVFGVCDSDCRDMSAAVNAVDGTTVAKDETDDGLPIVTFTPAADAHMTIRLTMRVCTIEPCAYAVGIFVR